MPLPFQPKPLDADAAAYIQRSGATDRAAINAFVRGVKALGLWNNMVCWPLRSSQNAGNGDTVYSLGGLGTFNGTRVNGPAWGADGMVADNYNKTIRHTAGRDFGTQPFTVGACWKTSPLVQTWAIGLYQVSTSFPGYDIGQTSTGLLDAAVRDSQAAPATLSRVTAGQFSDNVFGFAVGARSGQTLTSYFNGTSVGTSSNLAANVNFVRTDIDGRLLSRDGPGLDFPRNLTQSFGFLIKGQAINPASLYTLYKSTLGTGLGLP